MCLKVSTRAMATSTAFRERPSNAVERPLWSLGGGTVEIVHRLGSVAATAHQGAPRLGGRPGGPEAPVAFDSGDIFMLRMLRSSISTRILGSFPVPSGQLGDLRSKLTDGPPAIMAQDATCLYSVGLLLLYAGNRRRGWDLQRWDITIWLLRR